MWRSQALGRACRSSSDVTAPVNGARGRLPVARASGAATMRCAQAPALKPPHDRRMPPSLDVIEAELSSSLRSAQGLLCNQVDNHHQQV